MTTKRKKAKRQEEPQRPDIVAAMNGRFKRWFPGNTWNGWITVLKAAFALPMSPQEIEFFKSIAGGREPPKRRVAELYCVCGRRAGKDSVASLIAAHAAVTFSDHDRLRPGEFATILCLATDRDQARIVLRYIKSFFSDLPSLKAMVVRETASGFELDNSVVVEVTANSGKTIRGRAVALAILDEMSQWRDETSTAPDTETYVALKPSLASLNGMIIGISTPYRRSGLLWDKYKKHFGQNDDDVLVIQCGTRALNPTIPQALIDAEIAADPAKNSAEWLAEWRTDIAGFLDLELIEAAVDRGVMVRPPSKLWRYTSFTDPSGGAKDSFTTAVSHDENGVAVLDALLEIKAPFNPQEATKQVVALLKSYGLSTTTGDKYAANWVVSAFAEHGVTYRHSERDRSAIYLECLPLFTSGRVRLIDTPGNRLVNQFAALERRSLPGGRTRVDHPAVGGRDDSSNSAAGALIAASTAGTGGLIFPDIDKYLAESAASGSTPAPSTGLVFGGVKPERTDHGRHDIPRDPRGGYLGDSWGW
jgi:hypothetical protein